MPAEGGEPQLGYEQRQTDTFFILFLQLRLLDWTADGRYLAIGSDKGGKGTLDLLPMKDGKAAGEPVFVKYGDFRDGQTTANGGLIYHAVKPGGRVGRLSRLARCEWPPWRLEAPGSSSGQHIQSNARMVRRQQSNRLCRQKRR